MANFVAVTPSPEGLRALSHPVRLRMLGMLRLDGPATATALARRLGLNSGATSYHLRQLAQHGFIEDDRERGNARERWWRAVHTATHTHPESATTEEERDTYDAYLQAVVTTYAANLQRSVELRRRTPPEWLEAGTISDWGLRLTPERALELTTRLQAVIEAYEEDERDTPGALSFEVNLNTFLHPHEIDREGSEPDR